MSTLTGPEVAQEPDAGGPARRRRPRRRALTVSAMVVALLLVAPVVSFGRALTYPGSAPTSVRAVEWVRDHGGAGLVDAVEAWWYARNPPPSLGRPQDALTSAGQAAGASPTMHVPAEATLPVVSLLPGAPPAAGEGSWRVAGSTAAGAPSLYTTWFRPDARHLPVVVGAALMPTGVDVLHLVAGTREPVPGARLPDGAEVPSADRVGLVAVFNGGFKTKDARGGWYADGKTLVPLVDGAASLVITRDGRTRIGAWGTDVTMTPAVVAVRQNLQLVVRGGHPVPGLSANAGNRWGSSRNQFEFTWRSGVGTDAHGDLIYVAGQGLTLATLARAMADAGIRTGMELDIHPAMVTFNFFSPATAGGRPAAHKLLTGMKRPATRYLTPDQRDFFYVTTR